AEKVSAICAELGIPYIFKASYRKANRTSANSFTGLGDEKALGIIQKSAKQFSLPSTTDIHAHEEAAMAAKYLDILQIPAYLCRPTALPRTSGGIGKIMNVKKRQFHSGSAMKYGVRKILRACYEKFIFTDRRISLGYQSMIVDYRHTSVMKGHCVPVVID